MFGVRVFVCVCVLACACRSRSCAIHTFLAEPPSPVVIKKDAKIESSARRIFWPFRMLDSKKPSNLIKRFQANDVELKVTFLDDKVQVFGVKVSFVLR